MKIDVSKIEGFEAMSAEDKLKAVMEFEFETPQPENGEVSKLKAALSKANGEAAEWKRQFREKQTEQERAEAERAENEKAVQEELKALRRDKVVSEYTKQCMGMGYDTALAVECAEAMADGRFNDVFAIQSKFMEARTKEIEAAALNKQPGLSRGAPPTSATAEAEAENKMRHYFGLPPKK